MEPWEYRGSPKKGLAGEMGELNFRISLDKVNKGKGLNECVIEAFDHYLNGPDGFNTEVRNSEMGEGKTDEELGDWIIKPPAKLEPISIAGKEFLSFTIIWRAGEYYILPVSEERFLTLTFRYTISANSGDEYADQESVILRDVSTITDSITFK